MSHFGDYRVMPEEEAKRLETAEKNAVHLVINGNAQLRAAREEILALKRVLEWYADSSNWRPRGLVPKVAANEDRGRRARLSLGRPG